MKGFIIFPKPLFLRRFYCLKSSTKDRKSFQHTVLLPKTSFPGYLKPNQLVERDEKIQKEAKFLDFYNWQRENLKGEYVLHDGPPYANGKPHIGHAVNKIMKDIILRSKVIRGKRVHYVPGWDCHGLPIELAALKNTKGKLSALELRQKARKVAKEMSEVQKDAFKQWGVMGDWEKQCYYTYDTSYVVNQLQIFWNLFEKGLIYHDLKPVFWSPSSKSALAEAELEYKNHTSLSVVARFEIPQTLYNEPLYLLVWTTTPWTLPLNEAVYCSPNIKYSVVKISTIPGLYILATDFIKEYEAKLKAKIEEVSTISSRDLKNFKYKHPWHKDQLHNIFESSNLKLLGTGLLHSVPGNGHEDFLLGLENKLKVVCLVDENGCYVQGAGPDLAGLDVLNRGTLYVVDRLSPDILIQEKYEHSYPYDWRTKKPVIIRASSQWFIDCEQLKDRAVESLGDASIEFFESRLKTRPYWCLSRQRKWGVPIPAFFHKTSGRPLISKNLVNHICDLMESSGPDIWWTENLEILFPKKFCSEFCVQPEDVVKGEDIMDIWFDSGISWSYALEGKKSEIYLEGVDQYTGWFQSSLLTSIAVRNEPPFKKILTHGFVVDEENKKMSKSLGNVVDPEAVIKGTNSFGIDTLRWWVAHHSQSKYIPVSNRILQSNLESVKKLRLIFRFLLGALNDTSSEEIQKINEFTLLDVYLLNKCFKFYHEMMNFYEIFNMYGVCSQSLYFLTNEVSSLYVNVIKDRLYCDEVNSNRRKSCQYTLNGILDTLCCTVAPILPHLVEEVYSYHPFYEGKKIFFYNKDAWTPPKFWENNSSDKAIQLVNEIKGNLIQTEEVSSLSKKLCIIQAVESDFELLKKMQNNEVRSTDSELTELLQVAEVFLKVGDRQITTQPCEYSVCARCRRCTVADNGELCKRCFDVIS